MFEKIPSLFPGYLTGCYCVFRYCAIISVNIPFSRFGELSLSKISTIMKPSEFSQSQPNESRNIQNNLRKVLKYSVKFSGATIHQSFHQRVARYSPPSPRVVFRCSTVGFEFSCLFSLIVAALCQLCFWRCTVNIGHHIQCALG